MRSVAINVGANTNEPGFRGPIHPDGRFEYVPIPESAPTREDATVPTYADLDLSVDTSDVADTPVHLDPTFAQVHDCERYTYGDPHGVKARPLLDLDVGDYVFFYATLTTAAGEPADWIAPEWGTYLIGHFRLERDPLSAADYREASDAERALFSNNAHVKRDPFDAEVLLYGDGAGSELYERAIPLSTREAGVDANRLVTELSSDSGKGPWWRRPMKFDREATEELLAIRDSGAYERAFE
ncbi:hypothetical protein [Natronomonas sp.]|uniref:Nmad3 family putative nucleotide modification protein n=1 Tax=Natronomonas sp. TaxID=2184060 RepID=UPI002FC38C90